MKAKDFKKALRVLQKIQLELAARGIFVDVTVNNYDADMKAYFWFVVAPDNEPQYFATLKNDESVEEYIERVKEETKKWTTGNS